MKRSHLLFVLLSTFTNLGCVSFDLAKGGHSVEYFTGSTNPEEYGDTFDWQNRSSLEFITQLKQRPVNSSYVVLGIHKHWVKKSDIPELVALLDSTERCAAVDMSITSFIDLSGSTVGNEAAYLIKGYIQGEYPTELNSSRFKVSKRDKEELKVWWKNLDE